PCSLSLPDALPIYPRRQGLPRSALGLARRSGHLAPRRTPRPAGAGDLPAPLRPGSARLIPLLPRSRQSTGAARSVVLDRLPGRNELTVPGLVHARLRPARGLPTVFVTVLDQPVQGPCLACDAAAEVEGDAPAVQRGAGLGRQTRFAAGHGELTAHVTVGVGDLENLDGVLLVSRVHPREGDRGVRAELLILDSQIAQPLLRQLTVADGLVEVLLRIAAGQGALLDGAAGGLDVLLLRARRTDLDRGRALRARDLGVDLLRADRRRLIGGRGVGLDLGS